MLPFMKAEKTFPGARKPIASTAPDETVNAFEQQVANPDVGPPLVDLGRDFFLGMINESRRHPKPH